MESLKLIEIFTKSFLELGRIVDEHKVYVQKSIEFETSLDLLVSLKKEIKKELNDKDTQINKMKCCDNCKNFKQNCCCCSAEDCYDYDMWELK